MITRRIILSLFVLLCGFISNAQKRPNVILFLADDLGFNDVGYNNPHSYYLTPTIDSLAGHSLVLSSFYSMSTCSPTRASIMTGTYPARHGIYAVDAFSHTPSKMRLLLGGESKTMLNPSTYKMPVLFKQEGYVTAIIGKWHLGDSSLSYKQKPLFDSIIGVARKQAGNAESYFLPAQNISFREDPGAPTYLTDHLTYEARQFIHKNRVKPFFLYLAHYAPHVPLHAKRDDVEVFGEREPSGLQNRPSYAAMIYALDRSLRDLLKQLEEDNLIDNTIVFFLSDNGGQLISTDNAPLRGQKGELSEGGIHVPAFIWGKNITASGNNSLSSVVDLLPTMASILGAKIPGDVVLDGASLQPLLRGNSWTEREIYFHSPGYTGNGNSNAAVWQAPGSAVRRGKWKLVENLEDSSVALYDLSTDVSARDNLARKNVKLTEALLSDLRDWQRRTGALFLSKGILILMKPPVNG